MNSSLRGTILCILHTFASTKLSEHTIQDYETDPIRENLNSSDFRRHNIKLIECAQQSKCEAEIAITRDPKLEKESKLTDFDAYFTERGFAGWLEKPKEKFMLSLSRLQ